MRRTDTIVVGAGQAGLATSRCLTAHGIDHVVIERGRLAERWRSERWDSLRLLTPRWMTRLPGWRYAGPDPDGFMDMAEVIALFERYARSFDAPVEEETTVWSVSPDGEGHYRVVTDRGVWTAPNVVIATGYCDRPFVPEMAQALSGDVHQIVPSRYRRPDQLPDGGVLVVGASASGVQLAEELRRAGREVTLAVGRHTRMPRRYRGADVLWWLDRAGVLDETPADVFDLAASRKQPSMQLVGRPDHATLDLEVLRRSGVRLVGHATGADGSRVTFAGDLERSIAASDRKLRRVLRRIDAWIAEAGVDAPPAEPLAKVGVGAPPRALDLRAEGIRTVLWATGFTRSYPWLKVPVLDARGELVHEGGVTPAPGLFVLGHPFLRHRKSSFIDGAGADARAIVRHIAERVGASEAAA